MGSTGKSRLLAFGLTMLAGVAWAQESAPASASAATQEQTTGAQGGSPVFAVPNPGAPGRLTPQKPRRNRVISPEVAAQLSAAAPKYTPPPPKPPEPEEDEEADLRELDKPRNGIIRLPKYIVTEPRPPVFTERAISTDKGLADIAMKRYLGETYKVLNSFTLPLFGSSPEKMAMAMYEEEERLRNMADLRERAGMVSTTDRAAGLYVKRQVEEAFVRPGNFDWRPMGR